MPAQLDSRILGVRIGITSSPVGVDGLIDIPLSVTPIRAKEEIGPQGRFLRMQNFTGGTMLLEAAMLLRAGITETRMALRKKVQNDDNGVFNYLGLCDTCQKRFIVLRKISLVNIDSSSLAQIGAREAYVSCGFQYAYFLES